MGRQKLIAGLLVVLFGIGGIAELGWAQTTNGSADTDSCGPWPDMKQCYPSNVACSEAYLQKSVEIAKCRSQKIAASAGTTPEGFSAGASALSSSATPPAGVGISPQGGNPKY